MPKSVKALVTPTMLQWARELAGCSLEAAGKSAGRNAAAVAAWESPESGQRPTILQAQQLARAYRVPLAYFYMEHPAPDMGYNPVPEFRRIDPATGAPPPHSRQLRWMIRQAQQRQSFAIELLQDDDAPPVTWVGSASLDENPETVGGRIREKLGVGDNEPGITNKVRALDWWVERVENFGAFVSRYRPDGNEHWFVDPADARGLSLCHPLAPYIVLNSKDAPAGRTFTLMHELAHLHYGQCGLDDFRDEASLPIDRRTLEQRCNQVAAAILMPSADIQMRPDAGYSEFRESRPGGGSISPAMQAIKDFGGRYTRMVFNAYADGKLSRLEAADVLNVRISDIDDIRSGL